MRDEEFGRGQNTGLGWNDPTLATRCVAKVTRGVVPAHKEKVEMVFARAQSRSMQFVMRAVRHHE